MSFSVGDYAEKLLTQNPPLMERGTPSDTLLNPVHSNYSPAVVDQVDISKVEVPTNFVNALLEDASQKGESPDKVEESPVIAEMPPLNLEPLLMEVKALLVEVKTLLLENTSVGKIGVSNADSNGQQQKRSDTEEIKDLLRKIRNKRG